MGIKDLKLLINKYAPNSFSEKFLNNYKIIAIDISIYLYKFIYLENTPYDLLIKQIIRFIKNGVLPLYIFDGKPPPEKKDTLNSRSEKKNEMQNKKKIIENIIASHPSPTNIPINIPINITGDNLDINIFTSETNTLLPPLPSLDELNKELEKINKNIIVVTKNIINDCKTIFDLLGIPYIVANCEAESLCSKLIIEKYVDGCLSEDTDILANGGKLFLRNFNINSNKIIEYNLDKILSEMNISQDQFIDICILLGCDYTSTIKNIGPQKAYQFIKSLGNIENLITFIDRENNRFLLQKKKIRYIIPNNFDYQRARYLFKNCAENEDLIKIKENIKLRQPNINNFITFIKDKNIKIQTINDVNQYLPNFYNKYIQ